MPYKVRRGRGLGEGGVANSMAPPPLAEAPPPAPPPLGLCPAPNVFDSPWGRKWGRKFREHGDTWIAWRPIVELQLPSAMRDYGRGGPIGRRPLMHVALQVAFYRLHGSVSACAEAPPLRPRPLPHPTLVLPPGPRCRTLAKAMEEPNIEPEVLRELLWEAVEAQQQRMEEVAAGQGAERHLRALGLTAVAGGEPLPELFRDLGYAKATHFRLCTLQVRSARGCLPIKGPLVPDGYGIGVGHAPSTSGHAHSTSGHAHSTSGPTHPTSGPSYPTSCLMEPTSCLEDPFFNPSEFTSGPSNLTSCPQKPISGHETSPDPSQHISGYAGCTSGCEKSTSGHEEHTSGHMEPTSGHEEHTSGQEKVISGHAEPTSGHAPLRVAVSAFASCGGTGAERLGAELRAALDQLGALLKGQRPPAAGG
ncbi:uncharacterized protein LOC107307009 [Coturnix japonica]|uniref:uncharacterized protein LOC107307009 n=1 Tax=Coturnix japonica TaxID=93934 RepID=UPI0007777FDD|nr:uncharacterized protein LOC107307009 [Coturnix japonica]